VKATLAAHLHGQVGEHHARGDGQVGDDRASELDGAVIGAIRAQLANDIEDKVLGGDPGRQVAVDLDANGGGNLEPEAALGPDAGHFGGANAGRESAESAVRGGMRIGSDHHHARQHVAALGQHLVADAAAAHVVEVADVLGLDEFADRLVGGGGDFGFRGHAVIEDDDDALGIPHAGGADLAKALADQVGVLVRHGEIDGGGYDLVGRDRLPPRRAGQNLLG